jgi:hypothetical protein
VSIEYFGNRFNQKDPWGPQEKWITESILQQIDRKWPDQKNLVINTTWLGPAFDSWNQLLEQNYSCDNLFWLAIVDPICMLPEHIQQIEKKFKPNVIKYIGLGFSGEYHFNTGSIATLEDFPDYSQEQLLPLSFKHKYLLYNRKPKPHRIDLVNKIFEQKLESHGIMTLGSAEAEYDVSEGKNNSRVLTINENSESYTRDGKFNARNDFSGIPLDVCSLGRLDIWQNHFLNVVSETVFFPWDNMFITEKTWKPILGLRPFIINGQSQIYDWLRNQGFKTFNHYWNFANLENVPEYQIHDEIIKVVKYVCSLEENTLNDIYQQMLPDLQHNRKRFFEFAEEQRSKVRSLF